MLVSSNSPICEGQTLNLTGGPNAMISYAWTGPNSFSSTQQNPNINNATTAASGVYTLSVTDNNNCNSSATVNVLVAQQPTVTASANTPICEGQTLQLSANNIVGVSYVWNGPGSYSSNQQNPGIPGVSLSNNGTYTVTASIGSCTSNSSVNVTVHPIPVVTLIKEDDTCMLSLGIVQSNISNGANPINYLWNTGATTANLVNVSAGIYSLTVTDANNCVNTASVSVLNLEIECVFFVYVANAFTPNADGVNDIIPVHGRGVEQVKFTIFNRWGNKVFETNQLNDGWDGTFKGEPQNSGLFVYMLEGTFINGKTFKENGDIVLIK